MCCYQVNQRSELKTKSRKRPWPIMCSTMSRCLSSKSKIRNWKANPQLGYGARTHILAVVASKSKDQEIGNPQPRAGLFIYAPLLSSKSKNQKVESKSQLHFKSNSLPYCIFTASVKVSTPPQFIIFLARPHNAQFMANIREKPWWWKTIRRSIKILGWKTQRWTRPKEGQMVDLLPGIKWLYDIVLKLILKCQD